MSGFNSISSRLAPIMAGAALSGIILLSFVLAAGFLLVILSGALFGNWITLLVGASVRMDLDATGDARDGSTGHSPVVCYVLFAGLAPATFVLAPVPNSLCQQCSGADDFSADYSSAPADFGRFLTAIIVVSGLALPLVLAHSEVIHPVACWMSIAGGVLVYGTITVYSRYFSSSGDTFA